MPPNPTCRTFKFLLSDDPLLITSVHYPALDQMKGGVAFFFLMAVFLKPRHTRTHNKETWHFPSDLLRHRCLPGSAGRPVGVQRDVRVSRTAASSTQKRKKDHTLPSRRWTEKLPPVCHPVSPMRWGGQLTLAVAITLLPGAISACSTSTEHSFALIEKF